MWTLLQLQDGDLVWAVVIPVQICYELVQYRFVRVIVPEQETVHGGQHEFEDRIMLRIQAEEATGEVRLVDADFVLETLVLEQRRGGQTIASLDYLGNLHINLPPERIWITDTQTGRFNGRKVAPVVIESYAIPEIWRAGILAVKQTPTT